MNIINATNKLLRRVFRSYQREEAVPLSEHAQKILAVEERHAMTLAARDNEVDNRKDKRQVTVQVKAHDGSRHLVKRGIFMIRDKESVQEKLRKEFGGKTMRRILKAERRRGREEPEALEVKLNDKHGAKLVRGVDFALVTGRGGPFLIVHDKAQDFSVSYTNGLLDHVLGEGAGNENFALNC